MIYIVYWSQSGNTQAMAQAVAEGAKSAGAEVSIMEVSAADDTVLQGSALLLGCPAMGSEELDDTEMEPFFSSIEGKLSGKNVGLFGSYDWGDGEWMRTWQARCEAAGAKMLADGVIANLEPDSDALAECKALGEKAAKA
ncbi:MAG: flavodoxin [Clostridia bacterium]|nr:flavodoxin [Clostridia bacterium]